MRRNLLKAVVVLSGALMGSASFVDTAFGKSTAFCKVGCNRKSCLAEPVFRKCKRECEPWQIQECSKAFNGSLKKDAERLGRRAGRNNLSTDDLAKAATEGNKKGKEQAEKDKQKAKINGEIKKLKREIQKRKGETKELELQIQDLEDKKKKIDKSK